MTRTEWAAVKVPKPLADDVDAVAEAPDSPIRAELTSRATPSADSSSGPTPAPTFPPRGDGRGGGWNGGGGRGTRLALLAGTTLTGCLSSPSQASPDPPRLYEVNASDTCREAALKAAYNADHDGTTE